MTLEELVVIDPSDIIGVQVECPECHATITSVPANWRPRQVDCPNCPKTLWYNGSGDIDRLGKIASAFREMMTPGSPKIRLVLKAGGFRKVDKREEEE